ncbi:MAG: hypothetical protein ABIS84_10525, partial [Arachnia sp.]
MTAKKTTTRRRRTWVPAGILGLLVLLGGAWAGAYVAAGDQVPANATVEGVAIGGLSPAAAEQKLREELDPKYAAAITVGVPETDVSVTLDPLKSGLALDYAKAVKSAGGGASWNPADIWRTFAGGSEVELPKLVDQSALAVVLDADADAFATDPTDATLAYKDGAIART